MQIDRRHVLLIVAGNLLLAAASSWFLLPSHVISGGINGIAVILEKLFLFQPYHVINVTIILCFIMGVIFLGRDFALKTFASTILYPFFLQLISMIHLPVLPQLIASLIGGLPPLILHKYFNLPVSVMVLLCDSFIVLGGLIVYGWMPVLVGLLSVAACSKALSFTLNRSKQ